MEDKPVRRRSFLGQGKVAATTVFPVKIEFRDYLSDELHHTLFTTITVNP